MHRWLPLLIVSSLAILGCSGLTEGVVELLTGISVEEQDDGSVVITDPDGKTQTLRQGDSASVPEGFALPLPPGDLELESVLEQDEGAGATVSYKLPADADFDALVTYYEAWFTKVGAEVEKKTENMAGMRSTVLRAEVGGQTQAVTLVDALGTRSLILIVE